MDATDPLIEKLRATRSDYAEEAVSHKFLLDAVFGTGGFRGKYGVTTVSQLGWAAEAYSAITSSLTSNITPSALQRDTYLDQFPREDQAKFDKRIDIAHYTNYVGPILDLLLSYLHKATVNRDKVPDAVEQWMEDADGNGTNWDTLKRETITHRAATLGWCPVLFDLTRPKSDVPDGLQMSVARAREEGIKVRAIPLYPINVLEWITDENRAVVAVKIRTDHVYRADLLSPKVNRETYSLWYADRVERYVVTTPEGGAAPTVSDREVITHDFGRIPIVVFRVKPTTEDNVRGVSAVCNAAVSARRLFNLESEMDDHIRNQVFATLGLPVQDMDANITELVGGTGSVIKIPHDANMPLHYVAPPSSCADTIEKRMEVTVREIYRTEQVEHTKATGTTATSGVARAYEFEGTNRRLGGMAIALAQSEQDSLRLVSKAIGKQSELTVSAPTDFSIEDLESEIDGTIKALEAKLGATAETELKRRLINRMLPNLPQSTQDAIDSELEEIRKQSEQDEALRREAEHASLDGDDEGEIEGSDDDQKAA